MEHRLRSTLFFRRFMAHNLGTRGFLAAGMRKRGKPLEPRVHGA